MQSDTKEVYKPTRRESTAEERKSLIDKYKDDINRNDIDFYEKKV